MVTDALYAARCGHLDILRWARANGAPWNVNDVCDVAAGYGNLEMLQWARENGAPWITVLSYARQSNHPEVLQWAYANGVPELEDE